MDGELVARGGLRAVFSALDGVGAPDPNIEREWPSACDSRLARKSARAARLRTSRDENWPEGFVQLARSLIVAGLPLERTRERQLVRKVRFGEGTLTIVFGVVGENAEMPFGNDVDVLHFLFDRLDPESDEPFIEWRTAREYFVWWGLDPESPKNQRDLRERWKRVSSLVVQLEYEGKDGYEKRTKVLFPEVRLPRSIKGKESRQAGDDGRWGVRVDEEFWRDAVKHRVPMPRALMLETREDPFLRRLALFLAHRVYAAASESVIPWRELQSAIGSADSLMRRVRSKVLSSVKEMKLWWPELDVACAREGLVIRPAKRQLMPDGDSFRRVQSPAVGSV